MEKIGDLLSSSWMASLATIVLVLALTFFVRKVGRRFIERSVRQAIQPDKHASPKAEKAREDTLIAIFSHIFKTAVWLASLIIILASLGINIAPLIAGVSILGLAVGFGAQSLVKDIFSGIFIVLENQFRVGDSVSLAGISGTVETINIRQTVLRDASGNKHYVPNGEIKVCTNKSIDFSKVNMIIPVSYRTDLDKAQAIIDKIGQDLAKDKDLSKVIIEAPAFVRIDNFGPYALELKVLAKVKPGQQWLVAGRLRAEIKKAFDRNRIEIPKAGSVLLNA